MNREESLEAQRSFLTLILERDTILLTICHEDPELRKKMVSRFISGWLSEGTEESKHISRKYLLVAIRLATQSPFDDIRETFLSFLKDLKGKFDVLGLYEPDDCNISLFAPSSFIPPCRLPSLTKEGDTKDFLMKIFLLRGRIPQHTYLMSYHTSYASKFEHISETLFSGGGPLPISWRHYLAIMGASRHNNQSLIIHHQIEFFRNGGDPAWLVGISFAPNKLRRLSSFNALLAHQPWKINASSFAELTSGEDSWSVPELVQAIIILTTSHCLSGFFWATGIPLEVDRNPELDGFNISFCSSPLSPISPISEEEVGNDEQELKQSTSKLIFKLKAYTDNVDTAVPAPDSQKSFNESEIGWKPKSKQIKQKRKIGSLFGRYHGGVDLCHEDFDVKSNEYEIFRLHDFSWESQGYSLMNRYYPGMGDLFEAIFAEAFTLTDYSLFDSSDVDTTPFREAIWYYVLRLNGMFHDDYEYSKINVCLNPTLKRYIKKATCYPELLTLQDYNNMGLELFDAEKTHLNFLILEARRQAELLYALRALLLYKGA